MHSLFLLRMVSMSVLHVVEVLASPAQSSEDHRASALLDANS